MTPVDPRAILDQLYDADAEKCFDDPAGVPVYVVDPNGFVILRYAPGFDPGGWRRRGRVSAELDASLA
mgnify:CR=1 FL=1